jgi:hypothetical protein
MTKARIILTLSLLGLALLAGCSYTFVPTHWTVLYDMTGSEVKRMPKLRAFLLSVADPRSPGLLYDGDSLTVIPVRALGHANTVYPVIFEGAYQEGKSTMQKRLQAALPSKVDTAWGTGLSAALRAANAVLAEQQGHKVLLVSGPGEDESKNPVTPEEVASGLKGTVVVMLNAGQPFTAHWQAFFAKAGVKGVLVFDRAQTEALYAAPQTLRTQVDGVFSGR